MRYNSAFADRWPVLTYNERKRLRRKLEAEAYGRLNRTLFALRSTQAQVRAAAKKLVDISICECLRAG